MKFYVYFLKSDKDGRYYIGYTSLLPEERLTYHNSGLVPSTRNRRPLEIIYTEEYADKRTALKREWYLNHPKGYKEKLEIIKNINKGS